MRQVHVPAVGENARGFVPSGNLPMTLLKIRPNMNPVRKAETGGFLSSAFDKGNQGGLDSKQRRHIAFQCRAAAKQRVDSP